MHKSRVRIFGTLSLLLAAGITLLSGCRTQASSSSWKTLLDASHTNGWKMVGPGQLKWEQGELVTHGGMGLLYYEPEQLGNCQIKVQFKLSGTNDNSGVFIRIPEPPKDPWLAVNRGYEVQIHNGGDNFHRTGCLYSITEAKNIVNAKVGDWSTMLITLRGLRTIVEVDGKVVSDFTEGNPVPKKKIWYEPDRGLRPEKGYIGLQNHGGDAQVHFKNVSVRPLK